MHPAADAIFGLKDDASAVTERTRGCQPGHAAADDGDVVYLCGFAQQSEGPERIRPLPLLCDPKPSCLSAVSSLTKACGNQPMAKGFDFIGGERPSR